MSIEPAHAPPGPLPCASSELDEFISRPPPSLVAALENSAGPILVLGAGGKIGLHLSWMLRRALAATGRPAAVTAVSRFTTLRSRAEFEHAGVPTLACDLSDPAALAALPDSDTIFFLAGVKFGTADTPELLHQLNVRLPQQVAERFPGARIAAFSSGCVYPYVTPSSGGADERCPPAPVGDYALSCLEREYVFVDAARRFGTRSVLVRLNYSVEMRYGVLLDIALKVWRREPIDLAMGYVNVIWQGDAVAYAIRSISLADSPPAVLNIAGPDVLSVRAVAMRFGEILRRKPIFQGEEASTAWLNDASRSRQLFGPPEIGLDRMLGWVAAWVQAGSETWDKATGFERRDGRF